MCLLWFSCYVCFMLCFRNTLSELTVTHLVKHYYLPTGFYVLRVLGCVMGYLNIRIPDHVKARLEEEAKARGLTLSEFVREVLASVAEGREPCLPPPSLDYRFRELEKRLRFLEDLVSTLLSLLRSGVVVQQLLQPFHERVEYGKLHGRGVKRRSRKSHAPSHGDKLQQFHG